jgi:hypothetical protein
VNSPKRRQRTTVKDGDKQYAFRNICKSVGTTFKQTADTQLREFLLSTTSNELRHHDRHYECTAIKDVLHPCIYA